jgi:hypothetical protein
MGVIGARSGLEYINLRSGYQEQDVTRIERTGCTYGARQQGRVGSYSQLQRARASRARAKRNARDGGQAGLGSTDELTRKQAWRWMR